MRISLAKGDPSIVELFHNLSLRRKNHTFTLIVYVEFWFGLQHLKWSSGLDKVNKWFCSELRAQKNQEGVKPPVVVDIN